MSVYSDSDNESVTYLENNETPLENRVIQPTDYTAVADLSGIPICIGCDRLIEEKQSKTSLACGHIYHFQCIVSAFWDHHTRDCLRCNAPIFDRVQDQETFTIIRQKKAARLRKKVEDLEKEVRSNKELLQDLKIVKKSVREASAAGTKFRKFGRQVSREFKEETKTLQDILIATKNRYREKLAKSQQISDWRKKKARAAYYMRVFNQKYHRYNFDRLSSISSLKVPNRWNVRRALHIYSWTINRWFRLKI